jgi:hypothetical protein
VLDVDEINGSRADGTDQVIERLCAATRTAHGILLFAQLRQERRAR